MLDAFRSWYAELRRAFFFQVPLGNVMERIEPMRDHEIYAEGYRAGFAAARALYERTTSV